MFLILSLFILGCFAVPPQYKVKNLAGPPEEFEHHRIPKPVVATATSASLNLWFSAGKSSEVVAYNALLSSTRFPVDGKFEFVLNFVSPIVDQLRLELLGPDGKPVPAEDISVKEGNFEIDDNSKDNIPSTAYIVINSVTGFYTFNVYSNGLMAAAWEKVKANPRPDGVLTFITSDSNRQLHTSLSSYFLTVGSSIGLRTTFVHEGLDAIEGDIEVDRAIMEVISPDGTTFDVPMKDDGLSNDLFANDGIFGAEIKATLPGTYVLQASVDGHLTSNSQVHFKRSTQHALHITDSPIRLTGKAHTAPPKDGLIDLQIGLDHAQGNHDRVIRAYAEVWGVDKKTGAAKAACWVGGVINDISGGYAKLVLDEKWLTRAGVDGPLVLQNVYITDMATSFPIDSQQSNLMKVQFSETIKSRPAFQAVQITKEMRFGRNPLPPFNRTLVKAGADNLLLLAGYCAESNPWSRNPSHFTNGFFPVDFGNHANDDYARKMMDQSSHMESFGLIGHSQGGMVSLHIHNYYWTGLSNAEGGRLIQTVGTPFQGSTAAGDAAKLGDIFGVGCGKNTDLSLDGAVNWLAGISMEARKDVHFYTTTYQQGNFFGDWCSLPMNLILQFPNDGVVELKYAQLPGGVNMGNTEKQCHTVDMTYLPQYDDQKRNAQMNAAAAR